MGGERSAAIAAGDAAIEGALSRHQNERECGGLALSVLAMPADAAIAHAGRWALTHGAALALVESADLDEALRAIVDAIPASRLLHAARQRVASLARCSVDAIDASLAARSPAERAAWIADLAAGQADVRVAGAVLGAFATTGALELTSMGAAIDVAAPLLSLGGRVAVVVNGGSQVAAMTRLAAQLCHFLPQQPLILIADGAALDAWLETTHGTAAASLVVQGRIPAPAPRTRAPTRRAAPRLARGSRTSLPAAEGRSKAERALRDALERDGRTRGRFRLGVQLPALFGGRPAEIDLYDPDLAIAVEVDGWHHFQAFDRYRRDRQKDQLLQRSRIFVVRVLEPDVWERLEYLVDQIADTVAFRRTVPVAPPSFPR